MKRILFLAAALLLVGCDPIRPTDRWVIACENAGGIPITNWNHECVWPPARAASTAPNSSGSSTKQAESK